MMTRTRTKRRIAPRRGLIALAAACLLSACVSPVHADLGYVNAYSGVSRPTIVALSADGLHAYAAASSGNRLRVYSRNTTTGELTFVEDQVDGVGGVDGLDRTQSAVVSADGKHVYAAGFDDDAVAVFSRNATTGALTFVEVRKDGVSGVDGLDGAYSVAISPDGGHVYATAFVEDKVSVFSRNATTGALTFVEIQEDGIGGVDGLNGALDVVVSPDDAHVYVTGQDDFGVAVFSRNTTTGALTFVEVVIQGAGGVDGIARPGAIRLSDDGTSAYVAGQSSDSVGVFSRNATTGKLTYLEQHEDGTDGVDGLDGSYWVDVSPDGNWVYAVGAALGGSADNAVVVFRRNPGTGTLTFIEQEEDDVDGNDGLNRPFGVTASPDDKHVYVASFGESKVSAFVVTECNNSIVETGEDCEDGNTTAGDCCSPSCEYEANGSACADDANGCTDDVCDGAGTCTHPDNSAPCDDGLFCNGADTCGGGACSVHAGDPCSSGPECAVTCNEGPDHCFDPPGTACTDDGNACTEDTCDGAGSCASDSAPLEGASCDDGDACTQTDTCAAGVCSGTNPVVCGPPAECELPGTCNAGTGLCEYPPEGDGTACDDDNACTSGDVCASGVCAGGPPLADGTVCSDGDQCSAPGTCQLGVCSGVAQQPDGTECDDGNACTLFDICVGGSCSGEKIEKDGVPCDDGETCTTGDACSAGQCVGTAEPDATPCDDGEDCTQTDVCMGGTCVGMDPAADFTPCDDGDLCTSGDACIAETCSGSAQTQVCRAPVDTGKASLSISNRPGTRKDKIKWKWSKGDATDFPEFEQPLTATDYALCIFQPGAPDPLLSLTAPAGGQCPPGNDCWKQAGTTKYKYKDKGLTPDGIQGLGLHASTTAGKAKASVKGAGANLRLPPLPANSTLRVELRNSTTGLCWGADHDIVLKDTPEQYKAKGD